MAERDDPVDMVPLSGPSASPLRRVEHRQDILGGEPHGFGCLLFDLDGRLVLRDGLTWLYTCRPNGEGWESWARPFDPVTLADGPPVRVLTPAPGEERAVLHHVIALAEDLLVGFYCTGRGVRAAVASAPGASFRPDPDFALDPEVGWETRGGSVDGWSLESNGAHVPCDDAGDGPEFWLGYDSYRREGRLGDLGWAGVRVDPVARRIELTSRHPRNPLPFRAPAWRCARCGGNLAGDVRVRGKRGFFYYIRPDDSPDMFIGLALSDDPLFQRDSEHFIVDRLAGDEEVAEKFQALCHDGTLHLFYENRLNDGTWRTAFRRYAMHP